MMVVANHDTEKVVWVAPGHGKNFHKVLWVAYTGTAHVFLLDENAGREQFDH